MPSTSDRFQARLELSNWFLQKLSAPLQSHAQTGSAASVRCDRCNEPGHVCVPQWLADLARDL